MFPRDRVIGSLAKYNIPYKDDEATESLVSKLAQFYADRTLTKSPITPADQAEAYFLLVSRRLSKTTGQVITVDGGLHEAFWGKGRTWGSPGKSRVEMGVRGWESSRGGGSKVHRARP